MQVGRENKTALNGKILQVSKYFEVIIERCGMEEEIVAGIEHQIN